MSIGNFPESLSQAMLVGIMLVGRLGVASQDFGYLSARFLRGFAVSANLSNTCWPFHDGECQSPPFPARLPQEMAQKDIKVLACKIHIYIHIYIYICICI